MISLPLVVLFGLGVFLLVRYGRTTILAALACGVFGLLLASTSWGPPTRGGVSSVADFVGSAMTSIGKSGPAGDRR